MQTKDKLIFRLGCLTLALCCSLIFLGYRGIRMTSYGTRSTYMLYASVANVGNLKTGAPVKLGGIIIGHIHTMELDPKSLIPYLTLTIDQKYKIPRASQLSIKTAGLLGEQYLELIPGPAELDGYFRSGDHIEDVNPAFDLERMIGNFLYRGAY